MFWAAGAASAGAVALVQTVFGVTLEAESPVCEQVPAAGEPERRAEPRPKDRRSKLSLGPTADCTLGADDEWRVDAPVRDE